MAGRGLLRGARGGSGNVFTVRKRAPPGHLGRPRERGRSRETGPSRGYLARRAARGAGQAGQLASQRGEAGQGPSISYMEGPFLILAGRNVFARTAVARRRRPDCGTAVAGGHDRVRARSLTAGGARWLTGRRGTFQLVAVVTQAGQ